MKAMQPTESSPTTHISNFAYSMMHFDFLLFVQNRSGHERTSAATRVEFPNADGYVADVFGDQISAIAAAGLGLEKELTDAIELHGVLTLVEF
jgi:hypothetical protein